MNMWLYLLMVVGFLLFLAIGFALGYFLGFNVGLVVNVRQDWIKQALEIIKGDSTGNSKEGKVN